MAAALWFADSVAVVLFRQPDHIATVIPALFVWS